MHIKFYGYHGKSQQPWYLNSWPLLAIAACTQIMITPVHASLQLDSNNLSLWLPTYDYFEAPQPFYNVTGVLINPVFTSTRDCTLQAGYFRNKAGFHPIYNASVATFNWDEADEAGCKTIAQAAKAVSIYAKTLADTSVPPVRLFLLQLTNIVKGYSGGPETEDYRSSKTTIPDGTPKITTALVPAERTVELRLFLNKLINLPTITVTQEIGPWNKIFRSLPYAIPTYCFLTMNTIFLLFSFYRLFNVIKKKEFRFERRNMIYVTGVLAAITTISHIPMQKQTLSRLVLSQLSALLAAQAFYALLLLWSDIFEMTRRRKELKLVNYLVYFAMLLQVVSFVSQLVETLADQPYWMQPVLSVVFWAMPAVQMLICCVYAYYIRIFVKQQKEIIISQQTIYALRWLSYLAIAGMFSFVLAMIANIINAITSLRGNPAAWAAQYLLQDLWRTIRVVALLLIMGIRIPKPISHNDYINSGDQLYTVHSNNNNNNNNNNHPDRWDNTKY